MNIGKYCLLHRLLSDVLGQCPLLIPVINEYLTDRSSVGLPHDIIDPPPEAPVLLLIDNCQDLLLPLFILALSCVHEAIMEMLLPVLFAMFPEVVTLFQAHLEAQEDFLYQKHQAIGDTATSGGLF